MRFWKDKKSEKYHARRYAGTLITLFSFLRALLGLRESSQCAFLRDCVGRRLAGFPFPMRAGRDIQERGKLGLCQAEPLAVSFELFGEVHLARDDSRCECWFDIGLPELDSFGDLLLSEGFGAATKPEPISAIVESFAGFADNDFDIFGHGVLFGLRLYIR